MSKRGFWLLYTIKRKGSDEIRFIITNAPNGWVGDIDKKVEKKLKEGEYIDMSQTLYDVMGYPVEVVLK